MNSKEHMMVCGAEEAGEVATAALSVAKALHKGLRFGQDDINPERDATAVEVLAAELNDMMAVVEMLQEAGVPLPGLHNREAIEAKKRKVRHWMGYAERRGSLTPNSSDSAEPKNLHTEGDTSMTHEHYMCNHHDACGLRGSTPRGPYAQRDQLQLISAGPEGSSPQS